MASRVSSPYAGVHRSWGRRCPPAARVFPVRGGSPVAQPIGGADDLCLPRTRGFTARRVSPVGTENERHLRAHGRNTSDQDEVVPDLDSGMNIHAINEGMQDRQITATKVMISGLSCFHVRRVDQSLPLPPICWHGMPALVSHS
jgi:hypothetical protein